MQAAIEKIEQTTPGVFKYTLYRDPGTTGRLEATVYPNSTSDDGEGIIIHSKAATKQYIHANYDGFLAQVQEAIAGK